MRLKYKTFLGVVLLVIFSFVHKAEAIEPQLHGIVKKASLGQVQDVCRIHPEWLNERDSDNNLPLHVAALSGRCEVVKCLVENFGVDVFAKGNFGMTALHFAACANSLETVKYLIDKGMDVNIQDEVGRTALELAASGKSFEMVQHLIRDFNASVDIKDVMGRNALFFAVHSGDTATAWFLINSMKMNVEERNIVGDTLLYTAIKSKNFDMVKFLVEDCHIDVNARSKSGATAVHCAVAFGDTDLVKYLLERKPVGKDNVGEPLLQIAVKAKRPDMVKFLVEKYSVDINFRDYSGATALYYAAALGDMDSVKYLIDHQADVNIPDIEGKTPLMLSMERDKLNIMRYLINNGADTCAVDLGGYNILFYAMYADNGALIPDLVNNYNVPINVVSGHGHNLLHMAAWKGDFQSALCLLSGVSNQFLDTVCGQALSGMFGTNMMLCGNGNEYVFCQNVVKSRMKVAKSLLHGVNSWGRTPLHVAIQCKQHNFIDLFLDNGADINAKDQNGYTPLYLAVSQGDIQSVRCLLRRGADAQISTNEGKTPLDCARERNYVDIVRLLMERGCSDLYGSGIRGCAKNNGLIPSFSGDPLEKAGKFEDLFLFNYTLSDEDLELTH